MRVEHRPTYDKLMNDVVTRLENGDRIAKIGGSSIKNGALTILDDDDNPRVILGLLPSGEYGILWNAPLGQPTIAEAQDYASGTRTSAAYGDLTGPAAGPSVDCYVRESGKLLVVGVATCAAVLTATAYGQVSFELSGANTLAATDDRGAVFQLSVAVASYVDTSLITIGVLSGLNPGVTTAKMMYRGNGSWTNSFYARRMTAMSVL